MTTTIERSPQFDATTHEHIVWIDDSPSTVADASQYLDSCGWNIRVIRPNADDLLTEISNASAILLDLNWSSLRKTRDLIFPNAKRLAQYILGEDYAKPIIFVSNYFLTAEFGTIEKEVNPTALTERVDRHSAVESTYGIGPEIDRKLHELIHESKAMKEHGNLHIDYGDDVESVFGVTPRQYGEMTDDHRAELTMKAAAIAIDLVDRTFDGSNADWIVVGGVPPRVIFWGRNSEDLDDELLDELGARYGTVPFAYSRPELML